MKSKIFTVVLLFILNVTALAQEMPNSVTATSQDPGRLVVKIDENWSLRPAINVSLMKYSLNNKDVSTGVVPGIGYGIQYKKLISLDMFADFEISKENQSNYIGLSLLVGLVQYLSCGIMINFIDGEEPQYSLIFGGSLPLKLN